MHCSRRSRGTVCTLLTPFCVVLCGVSSGPPNAFRPLSSSCGLPFHNSIPKFGVTRHPARPPFHVYHHHQQQQQTGFGEGGGLGKAEDDSAKATVKALWRPGSEGRKRGGERADCAWLVEGIPKGKSCRQERRGGSADTRGEREGDRTARCRLGMDGRKGENNKRKSVYDSSPYKPGGPSVYTCVQDIHSHFPSTSNGSVPFTNSLMGSLCSL